MWSVEPSTTDFFATNNANGVNLSMADELIYKDEAFQIIAAGMEVHNEKGAGFLEAVYQA
ncbi:MAG: hypothetical protein ACI8XO_000107 [Verrucomicrobiales bacterium]